MPTPGFIALGVGLIVLASALLVVRRVVLRSRISKEALGALYVPIAIILAAGILIGARAASYGSQEIADIPPAQVVGVGQQQDASGIKNMLSLEYGTTTDRHTFTLVCGDDQLDCKNAKLGDTVEYKSTYGPAGFVAKRTFVRIIGR